MSHLPVLNKSTFCLLKNAKYSIIIHPLFKKKFQNKQKQDAAQYEANVFIFLAPLSTSYQLVSTLLISTSTGPKYKKPVWVNRNLPCPLCSELWPPCMQKIFQIAFCSDSSKCIQSNKFSNWNEWINRGKWGTELLSFVGQNYIFSWQDLKVGGVVKSHKRLIENYTKT